MESFKAIFQLQLIVIKLAMLCTGEIPFVTLKLELILEEKFITPVVDICQLKHLESLFFL